MLSTASIEYQSQAIVNLRNATDLIRFPRHHEANGWPVGPVCEISGPSLPGLCPSLGERLGLRPESRTHELAQGRMPSLQATQARCLCHGAGRMPTRRDPLCRRAASAYDSLMSNFYDYDVLVIGGGHAGTRGGPGRGPHGGQDRAADHQSRYHRPDELQSGHRRRGQGADRARNRRPRRRHGPRHRCHGHPVPRAQSQQRSRHARPAGTGRQAGLSDRNQTPLRRTAEPRACGRKPSTTWSRKGRGPRSASPASAWPTARSTARGPSCSAPARSCGD